MPDKNTLSGLLLDGTHFEGKLRFKSQMRIQGGEVHGEIESENQLIVGKQARVNADVRVKHLTVMGRVEGTISNCDYLEIQEGGTVIGDIQVKKLDIKPGAVFDGKCKMVSE